MENEQTKRIQENWEFLQEEMKDGYVPSFFEWEEVFEDRDPAEFF